MISQDTFSERIRKARLYSGLSQARTAKALGCDPKTISRWESGFTEEPDAKLFLEFAALTHSDIAWLYEGGAPNGGSTGEDDRDS